MKELTYLSNNNTNSRVAKNTIFLTIRMFFVLVLTLYTTRILLSILGVVDYGIFNVVCGFVSMFTFINAAMTNGIQRFYNYELANDEKEGIKRVYSAALLIQLCVALILVLFAEIIGIWYLKNKMVIPNDRGPAAFWIFQFSIASFVFMIFQVPYSAVILAKERMFFYALISVLNALFTLALVLLLQSIHGDQLVVYGGLLVSIQIITLIAYYIYSKSSFKELKLIRKFDKNLLLSMLSFSGWNLLGTFSSVMKEQGVNVILNFFYGPVVNAATGIANQINGGLQSLVSNLSVAVRPQITKSYAQGNIDRTLNLTYSISKISCIVLYMFSLPILLELKYILHIWLGNNIPDHTYNFIIIIVLTSFLNNLNSAISGVVHSSGKMKVYQIVGSVFNLIALPADYIALKLGAEPEVALYITFISMILVQISALIVLKTIVNYSIKTYVRQVILPFMLTVALTILIPIVLHKLIDDGLLRFIIVFCFSILEIGLVFYMVGLNRNERELCISFLRKFFISFKI